jgi:colicin import membrane protein
VDDFHDFSYIDPNFTVTESQLSEFENELKIKIQNAEKKKVKREKAEEAKKKKLAEECALREKLREEEEKRRLEEQIQQEALAQQQKLLAEQRKIEQQRQERLKLKNSLQRAYDEYNESLQSVQKKIKRLKKKLREINDLEEKISSSKIAPSKDQLQKLDKKQETSDDILEAEEEEEQLLLRQENGEFNELLNWQDEVISEAQAPVEIPISLEVKAPSVEQSETRPSSDSQEALQSVQKKIKRLKKKLREINDLEEKLSSSKTAPSREQLLKLKQKQEICDEILEAEEEEQLLEGRDTGAQHPPMERTLHLQSDCRQAVSVEKAPPAPREGKNSLAAKPMPPRVIDPWMTVSKGKKKQVKS